MLHVYKTIQKRLIEMDSIEENSWIMLSAPSSEEIKQVSEACGIDPEDIEASLDDEEGSRVEVADKYTVILVDVPTVEIRNSKEAYNTIPLAIILTEQFIITVCLEESAVLKPFIDGKVKEFSTAKKTRFIYQILYNNATVYLNCLRLIDLKREEIEEKLSKGTKNSDLIELHELEKNLIYFTTSLRVNGMVLERLTRFERVMKYQEDLELLEDVIIENKQAIEMTNIYRSILEGTVQLFAQVIDNNLNTVMKLLAGITIVMSIPNIISGFYGMNVNQVHMPFAHNSFGFPLICLISLIICFIAFRILKKKDLL